MIIGSLDLREGKGLVHESITTENGARSLDQARNKWLAAVKLACGKLIDRLCKGSLEGDGTADSLLELNEAFGSNRGKGVREVHHLEELAREKGVIHGAERDAGKIGVVVNRDRQDVDVVEDLVNASTDEVRAVFINGTQGRSHFDTGFVD